jgi:RHS repeat-associated protein
LWRFFLAPHEAIEYPQQRTRNTLLVSFLTQQDSAMPRSTRARSLFNRTRIRKNLQRGRQLRLQTLEDRTVPTAYTWTSAVSGNFNDPTKWTPVGVPGSGDDATVSQTGITVTSPASTTVHSLTNAATLSVSSGTTFTVTSGGSETGTITVASGGLFDLTGGSIAWTNGTIGGAGTFQVEAAGTLALSAASTKTLDAITLNNQGNITFGGTSDLQTGDDTHINNSGTFAFTTDTNIHWWSGLLPTFTNTGTITKSSGAGLNSTIGITFNNTGGTITVNSGQLTLDSGTSSGGTYNAAANSVLDLTGGGTQNYTGTFTGSGAGAVRLSSGTINFTLTNATFNFPAGLFQWTGGTITGLSGSTLTNSGTMTLSGSFNKAFDTARLNNTGRINLTGTGPWQTGNTTITNSGTIDFQSDISLSWNNGNLPVLVNTGTVQKSGGIGTSSIGVVLNNNTGGTIASQSGTLSIDRGGSTSAGAITATSGNTVQITTDFTFNAGASESGAGQFAFTGGTLTAAAPTSVQSLNWTGGTITGNGGLTVTGNLTMTGGNNKDLSATTLTNNGAATLNGTGYMRMGNAVTFQNNGAFTFLSDAWVQWAYGNSGNAFNNAGSVTKTSSTSTGTSGFNNLDFNSTGTVDVASGILFIDRGTSSGDFIAEPGATLQFDTGTTTLNAGASISGTGTVNIPSGTTVVNTNVSINNLSLSGGTIAGTGTGTVLEIMNWSAGTIAGNLVVSPGATFSLSGGSNKDVSAATLTNDGTATISGTGYLRMGNGATFQNNGSFTFLSDVWVQYGFGSSGNAFNNAGTVTKTSSTSTGTSGFSSLDFNCTGTVNVASGTLFIDHGTSSGSFNVAPAATLQFNTGTTTLNAGASFSGTGVVNIPSGTTVFNANVSIANLNLSGGTTSGIGTLTVSNLLNWTSGVIAGNTAISPSAALAMSSGNNKDLSAATLTNNGIATFTGVGAFRFGNAATLRNVGTFDIQTTAPLQYGFGSSGNRVVNTGQMTKSAGGGTTQLQSVDLDNSGSVEVSSGTLQMTGAVVQLNGGTLSGGIWQADPAASLVLPTNVTTNAATVILNGAGATIPQINGMTTNNGLFRVTSGLNFTTTGALTNNGTIRVGPLSTVTVAGAFTETASATFVSEIGDQPASGKFGQLNATGAATLNGKVEVDLVNGFGPTAGGNFQIMSYSSESGNFTFVSPTTPKQGDMFAPVVNATNLVAQSIVNAADLAVTDIFVPATATPGQAANIGYVVKNLSTTATVVTDWIDSVYLSKNSVLDPSAVLVQRVSHSGTLNGGATYNGQTTVPLPGINTGEYHVIVVADSRSFVPDTNRANNTLTAAATVNVTVPDINLAQPVNGTITNGEDIYYRVDLPPGKTVRVGASLGIASEMEMYVGYKYVPTRTSFDQSTFPVGDTSGQIIIPSTQAGPYYILLHGRESAAAGNAFTLQVDVVPFAILGLDNATGSNTGKETVTIHGAGFTPNTTARLVSGPVIRNASQVLFKDANTVYATFDLSGLATGAYDLTAIDGASADTRVGGFTVTNAPAGQLSLHVSAPAITRALTNTTVTVDYANVGGSDIPAPMLFLSADWANIRLPENPDFKGKSVGFLGINPDGPAGVLPAGFHGSITFPAVSVSAVGHVGIHYSLTAMLTPTKAVDWASLKAGMRPSHIPVDAWDAVFANFIAAVGPTLGSYQQALADDATYLSQFGVRTYDLARLVDFEVDKANSALGPATLLRVTDAAMPTPGLPLTFYRQFNQSIGGRYQVGLFGRGWTTNWDYGARTDPSGDVVLNVQGSNRYFERESDGSYAGTAHDPATLTLVSGSYHLREVDGTLIVYRTDGTLDYTQDANGNRITAGYDGAGHMVTLTHSSGPSLTIAYTPTGQISQITDSAGRMASFTYDAGGAELLTATDKYGTATYSYLSGQGPQKQYALSSVGWSDNTHMFFTYDSLGRFAGQQRDAGSDTLTYTYGPVGGVTIADANSQSHYDYDDSGRMVRRIDPLGNVAQYVWTDRGQVAKVTLPDGSVFTNQYDDFGRNTSSTDALGNVTSYTWTANNQMASSTDARGNSTFYSYDANGNLTRRTYADGTFETFGYDAQGNVTSWTNARGQTEQMTYNNLGLLTHKSFADSSSADYTYDARGNLLIATDATGTVTLTYNALDEIATRQDTAGHTLTNTYNSVGQRTQSVDQTGFTLNYTYNTQGRLAAVLDGTNTPIVQYTYNTNGLLTTEQNANGTTTKYGYDLNGNVTSIANSNGAVTNSDYAYTYDPVGRVSTMTTVGVTTTYGYDLDGQLTSVTTPTRSIQYAYDDAGNRTSVTDNNVATTYVANNRNEYTQIGGDTFSYDADGNLNGQTVGGVSTNYTFNQENQLIGISTPSTGDSWTIQLNALHDREGVTHNGVTTRYAIDPYGLDSVVSEYDSTNTLTAHYVYGAGLVAQVAAGGASDFYDGDLTGNVIGITDATGSYVNRYSYLPFGETTTHSAGVTNPFTFNGIWGVSTDPGLFYMRNREYDPSTGQFLSNDPLEIYARDPNIRRFVGNDPVEYNDPYGLKGNKPRLGKDGNPKDGINFPWGNWGGRPANFDDLNWDRTFGDADQFKRDMENWNENHGTNNPTDLKSWQGDFSQCKNAPDLPTEEKPKGGAGDPPNNGGGGNGGGGGQDSCDEPPPDPSDPGGDNGGGSNSDNRTPNDPNDLIGPAGAGAAGFVSPSVTLPYTIRFENKPTASLPAQVVTVTQTLDPNLDLNTFQLATFNFGSYTVNIPAGRDNYTMRVDARATTGLFVDITASLDHNTRVLTIVFQSIDPTTLDLTTDPLAGFLPPDDANHDGQGYVSYTVRAKAGLTTGAVINGSPATVQFDNLPTLNTNSTLNTIDAGNPTATVTALPDVETTLTFPVSWTGQDDTGGSGVAAFDVYVSDNGGPWTLWQSQTAALSANFAGQLYHTYDFYAVAYDNVGNVEPNIPAAEAVTIATDGAYARNDVYGVDAGRTLSVSNKIGVLANDPKKTGKTYTVQPPMTNPAHGTLTLRPDGSFVYVPNATFHGLDSFTYQTKDSDGVLGNVATVTLATQLVNFSTVKVTTLENRGPAKLLVALRKPASAVTTVDYTLLGGTATPGADFDPTPGTVTFQPGDRSKTISIPIINDTINEPNESFQVVLSNPTGAVVGDSSVATVTIRDDDPPPKVGFAVSASSFSEGAGSVTIAVTLSAASEKTISVNFAAAGGTAASGSDYTLTAGTLTFAPGETTKLITLNIIQDTKDGGNTTVLVKLSKPSNATLSKSSVHTLTIVDDDP